LRVAEAGAVNGFMQFRFCFYCYRCLGRRTITKP